MARMNWKRLRSKSTSGTAAVEFAMIAPVFLTLMFATFEIGIAFYADLVLANGVGDAARLIRTGQAQSSNMSAAQFRTALCAKISYLLSCDSSKLLIDVRSFSSFGTAAFPPALDGAGNVNPGLNSYQTGGSGQGGGSAIVLVRAFYKWKMNTPLLGAYFSNAQDNTRLLSTSVAFRNEPY